MMRLGLGVQVIVHQLGKLIVIDAVRELDDRVAIGEHQRQQIERQRIVQPVESSG